MGHTCENGPHLEKCGTLGKMGQTWKNGSHHRARINVCHTWKNGSHFGKGPHLVKCVTLGKMGHFWKKGSHSEKWVTL